MNGLSHNQNIEEIINLLNDSSEQCRNDAGSIFFIAVFRINANNVNIKHIHVFYRITDHICAFRAAVAAITNSPAADVFTSGGSRHDTSNDQCAEAPEEKYMKLRIMKRTFTNVISAPLFQIGIH